MVRNRIAGIESSHHEQSSGVSSLKRDNSKLEGKLSKINAKLQVEQQKVAVIERKRTSYVEKLRKAERQIAKDSSFIRSFQSQLAGVNTRVEESMHM